MVISFSFQFQICAERLKTEKRTRDKIILINEK